MWSAYGKRPRGLIENDENIIIMAYIFTGFTGKGWHGMMATIHPPLLSFIVTALLTLRKVFRFSRVCLRSVKRSLSF